MHTYKKSNSASPTPDELNAMPPIQQRADHRSSTKAQTALQQSVEQAPSVRQLKTIQAKASQSSHHQKLAQLQAKANQYAQRKAERSGLPLQLKSGLENLSGHSMDDVKVHYNSSQPAQLNAHAYAQGNQIHLAPGQEKQLPHEAWHVVQQKQGRVRPTLQMKTNVNINDDPGLEREADQMGTKAAQLKTAQPNSISSTSRRSLPPLYQLARTKQTARRATGGRATGRRKKTRDPFHKKKGEVITYKKARKSKKNQILNQVLKERIWQALMAANPRHSHGTLRSRGQATNNILHTHDVESVDPHTKGKYVAMMRHLSTVIAHGHKAKYVEVQAAISFSNAERTAGTVYVSANKSEKDLPTDWGTIEGMAARHGGTAKEKSRLKRHCTKAIEEVGEIKEHFKLEVVAGLSGQHAETKIDEEIKDPHAIYGGLRRPCGACRVNFKLKGRDRALPAHTGQLWTTNAATLSIIRHANSQILPVLTREDLFVHQVRPRAVTLVEAWIERNKGFFRLDEKTYVQKGQSVKKARDYDTDSEDEGELSEDEDSDVDL